MLLIKPTNLSRTELDRMVRSATFAQLADWLNSYVVKKHPDKEALREVWMDDDDPWAARAGWSLTTERIARSPEGLNLPALLERIESEMGAAAPEVQWTMNFSLIEIGIHFPSIATAPLLSEKPWGSIVTILFPKAVPRLSPRLRSMSW